MVPKVLTPSLLTSIRTHPHLPPQTWYLITSVVLSSLNRPDEIPQVVDFALKYGDSISKDETNLAILTREEKIRITRRMREGIVKATVIHGMPRTINALQTLHSTLPPLLRPRTTCPPATDRRAGLYSNNPFPILMRGDAFFSRVYGDSTPKVLDSISVLQTGSDDLHALAKLFYGHLLSNEMVLNGPETSCVIIAALVPGQTNAQLKGHLRGGVRMGLTPEQVSAVRDVSLEIAKRAGAGDGPVAKL